MFYLILSPLLFLAAMCFLTSGYWYRRSLSKQGRTLSYTEARQLISLQTHTLVRLTFWRSAEFWIMGNRELREIGFPPHIGGALAPDRNGKLVLRLSQQERNDLILMATEANQFVEVIAMPDFVSR